ncbi:RGS domain-containing protein [Pyronema domesticum]|uniref:Similar to Protein rax1 acc. no. Q9P7S8 n=1 Tax=Pyronema omphalodes (strain CBS 100304) TaxID=1076935 RepID=U4LGZ5_PYROM|nr:RGS domain-containing protein [Pyronema domesticum]CCX31374.1 Similar to Protein rax1; acc. no. Q9P7S8 [Pyronema omphalodes CBS 100304]
METPRTRLPTLFEVLSRRTLPPVDLFSFFIYMRDHQRSLDYLDFWLDVAQHMSLCRHYVRELRRSVLVSTPDLGDRSNSPALFPDTLDEKSSNQRLSAFLRNETPEPGLLPSQPSTDPSSSVAHTVNRADVRASAEKILYTYLLQGAEREIVLPQPILQSITQAIEVDGRDDPDVFAEAKDYVFQAMERDAFPGFLRSKALGNLVPASVMVRLVVGLLSMFAGFWAAFSLIFLDIKPRGTRLWLILPFLVGVYCLIAHQYSLDPIMGLLGISEYTFMEFYKVKEPYVRRLLIKRSIWILALTLLVVVALVCLYTFVPGKRL